MNRKKLIYIGIVLILTVILSITYFSYAFFTRQDILDGKLNIVTGTLSYKITSSDLDNNNSIVISANTIKSINIKITSLNDINSKYELYYTSISNNFDIGYSSSSDLPTGTINKNGVKNIVVNVKNNSNSNVTLTFGVEGGFINNNLVISNGNSISDIMDTVLVSFNANGGSVNPTSLLMIKGTAVGTLPTPTKGNENFLGWYLENTFTTGVSSSYQVNSNITLYAKWDPSLLIYDNGVRYVPLSTQSVWVQGSTSYCREIDNSLYMTTVSGGGCAWYTTNKIDVTNYSTLHIYVKSVTKSLASGGHVRFGLTNSLTTTYGGAYCADIAYQCYTKPSDCGTGTYTNFEKTLDISKYTGSYYLYFPTYANKDSETVYISKIWLD